MKLTVRVDSEVFTFGIAPESGDHAAVVSAMLTAAKDKGFLLIGNRAVLWHAIQNVSWES